MHTTFEAPAQRSRTPSRRVQPGTAPGVAVRRTDTDALRERQAAANTAAGPRGLARLSTLLNGSARPGGGDGTVQRVKRYHHGRKLYVNDEDMEPAPLGYARVSKDFHDTQGPGWTGEREPSRYYVGSGDLSGPLSFLHGEIEQGRHPSMTVTTLDSTQQAVGKYGQTYLDNRWELEQMGASVVTGVDATDPGTMSDTEYDEVHFENPHTGVYGGNPDADRRSVESNAELMSGSVFGLSRKLREEGTLNVTEGGFPYRSSRGREGMNLDRIAKSASYSVEPPRSIGTQVVKRTIGGSVQLPNSTVHRYRKPTGEGLDPVDVLVSPSTDWVTKYHMVRANPDLVRAVRARGFAEAAALLQQYLEMEELPEAFVAEYYGQDRRGGPGPDGGAPPGASLMV